MKKGFIIAGSITVAALLTIGLWPLTSDAGALRWMTTC